MRRISKGNMQTNDRAMINVDKHLAHMYVMALRDVLGYGKQRIEKFEVEIDRKRLQYKANFITPAEILNYGQDHKLFVLKRIKELKMNTKFCLAEIRGSNGNVMNIDKNIESIMLSDNTLACMVLKKEFKESYATINKFLDKIDYYIDSYIRLQPGTKMYYLNDSMIRECLKEEIDLDFNKRYETEYLVTNWRK